MELVIVESLHDYLPKLSTYLPCVIDINLFKFTFTVVFNYLWVDEVYIGNLWTRKIVLSLGLEDLSSASKGLSSINITAFLNIY